MKVSETVLFYDIVLHKSITTIASHVSLVLELESKTFSII